jgi:putative membrane protein
MLVQTVANAIALGLTVLLLPGIHMPHDNFLIELLTSGLIFGLLNAFVRPILQFIMFRYLFITFGLVLVVINIIILWMMAALTPDRFQVDGWLSLVLAGILILIFGAFFETLMGLQPPIEDHGPTVHGREQLFSLGSAPIYIPTLLNLEPVTEVENTEAKAEVENTEVKTGVENTEIKADVECIEATE